MVATGMSIFLLVAVGVAAFFLRAQRSQSWYRWLIAVGAAVMAVSAIFDRDKRMADLLFVVLALSFLFRSSGRSRSGSRAGSPG